MEMDQEEKTEKNGEKNESMLEESFLKNLYFFMKQRDTPIERIPHLGFKQINLCMMFKTVMELGGYHQVTAQQLWKKVYNILGGNPRSTSAATCTRRHYEKLLLPYEYHLAGYGDDIPITPSRQRKRFRYDDDDYSPSAKCQSYTHLHQFNQFVPPVPITLPSYLAVSLPTIPTLPSPLPAQPTGPYGPSLPSETGSVKQPLEFLRHLAQEYKSSSGWTEPLNLSKKPNRLETSGNVPSGNVPSSFAPLAAAKKEPKFLNEAPTFHPGKPSIQGIAEAAKSKSTEEPNAFTPSSPSAPNLWTTTPSSTLHASQRINYPTAVQTNSPEQSIQALGTKSASPSTSLSSARSTNSSFPLDPYGGMEIQIPLSLLQTWIKDGLILSSASNQQKIPQSKPNDAPSPPERTPSKTSDAFLFDYPADLSLKNHQRTSTKSDISKDVIRSGESRASENSRFSHVKPLQIPEQSRLPFYNHVPFFKPSGLQEMSIKPGHSATTRIQEQPGLKPPTQAKDGPQTGAAKSKETPEKAPASSLFGKDVTSVPLVHISPEHLKMLFLSSPLRFEREKIC
ncbi:AT-rich interaction domain 6 [Trichomycterus rosablanca]|uniref:AT-rich interaction domain 6 n=1 Tax=Trichomycterus rosablanca TaxID=2290929 RepID=UPI002F35496E